jgi:dephospho-CoA kinase
MRLVVGLTGGIGSGKSAAAEEFGRLGATVVDTDAIAHELTQAGGGAMPEVRRLFGDDFVDGQGAMDRARMRALAFRDPAARRRLEALLHPLIRAESERRIATAGGAYVIHVVPLLVESRDYLRRVSRVLVVDCPEDVQIARVRQRSSLADDEIQRIMRSQATREERLAAADDVIDNSGTLDALHKQVRSLHARYLELARSTA